MPYEIEWDKRGVYKKFSGHVSAAEFMQSIADTQNHPNYDRFNFTINNFLAVKSHGITESDVITFVAHGLGAQMTNAKIVVAIVANSEDILNLVRGLYAPMANYDIGYFPDNQQALAWITGKTGFKPSCAAD